MADNPQSFEELFRRANKSLPGGVNSPVRAFQGVGGAPVFVSRGEGPFIFDVFGQSYIDYVASWGALILGHCYSAVSESLIETIQRGTGFGAPTVLESEFAETIIRLVPSIEMLRAVNSGTEATMTAIRLARAYTNRDIVVKFNGCYHGHADSFLVEAGSGLATCGISGSPGVPATVAELTLSTEYNDTDLFQKLVSQIGPERIAAIIVEPVAGNMGLVLPKEGFLEHLRMIASEYGIVLIFDEVMSGFRVALGGAQERFGVVPDLTTLGKVVGGGLPVGVLGGKQEIMELLAPLGPVYQAGTLSGNPLAMAAGLAQLKVLEEENPYSRLEELTELLVSGVRDISCEVGVDIQAVSCGSMFGLFFSSRPVRSFSDAKDCDHMRFKRFFHALLEQGIYIAPSPYEAGFVSAAHKHEHVKRTLESVKVALKGT